MISAGAGSIVKVNGTSTATAMVAVSPGMAPITVPATTPSSASSRLPGDSAAWAWTSRSIADYLIMPTSRAAASYSLRLPSRNGVIFS